MMGRPSSAGTRQSWTPFYLQRRVLLAFISLCVVTAVVLECLFAISTRNQGLATSDKHLHYLWSYGPVALMTLLAMAWGPVVYQAQITAPWYRIRRGVALAEHPLLLDYPNMLPPVAITKSLKNHDWAVASTLVVWAIFKVLVIFSAGLITLSVIDVMDPAVPITLQSAFVDNNSTLATAGDLIYKTMDGIAGGALTYYPHGTSTHFAYQTFKAATPIGSVLQATVDAFEAGLLCDKATLEIGKSEDWGYYDDVDRGDLDETYVIAAHLSSETCHLDTEFGHRFDVSGTPTTVYFSRFLNGSCNEIHGPNGNRVGIIFALMNYTVREQRATNNDYAYGTVEILQSTQVLCQPVSSISQVDVVYNGTDAPNISVSAEAKTRKLEGVHPWDIMSAHFNTFWDNYDTIEAGNGFSVLVGGQKIDVDRYTELAYKSFVPSTTEISSLFNQTFLTDTFNEYYKRYAAQIVHRTLLQTASMPSTGSAPRSESRLIVRGLSCHLIAALLAAAIVFIVIVISATSRSLELPHDPGNIAGIALLLRDSDATFASLSNLGAANEKELLEKMRSRSYSRANTSASLECTSIGVAQESGQEMAEKDAVVPTQPETHPTFTTFQPIVLHPLARISVILVLAGMITGIEITLSQSQKDEGLAEVREDGYQHYLWTTLPALLLGAVALFYGAIDIQVRTLAPFVNLARKATFDQSINLQLFGRQFPMIMLQVLRSTNSVVIVTMSAMLLTSLLTAFAGSLFQVLSVDVSTPTPLRTVNAFSCMIGKDSFPGSNPGVGASAETSLRYTPLILQSNMSYPPFTYENLAFPTFSLTDTDLSAKNLSASEASSLTIEAQVPAVRSRLSCRFYNASEVHSKFDDDGYGQRQLNLLIDHEKCIDKFDVHQYNFVLKLNPQRHPEMMPDAATFAVNSESNIDRFFAEYSKACSEGLWTWGRFTFSKDTNQTTIAAVALGCNETIEAVDARTTFVGPDLRIDPQRPPVPDEGTARIWPLNASESFRTSLHGDEQLGKLVQGDNGSLVDDFFTMLTTSRYAIPSSYLSDVESPDATAAVVDAIRLQVGIMRAQQTSLLWRDPAGNCSDVRATYPATATLAAARRILTQDETTTRVLQALLAGTLVLALGSWRGVGRARGVLPRSPTSPASVGALVAGGNMVDVIPDGHEGSGLEKLRQVFEKGALFWMGWREPENEEDKGQGLGVKRFGIWVLREDGALWNVDRSREQSQLS